jgi:anti-sigma factor RsiW
LKCDDVQHLIDAYIDDELDLVKTVEVEQHLQDCIDCAKMYKERQLVQAAIHTGMLYHKAPAHLQKRIQSSLRQANKDSAPRTMPWRLFSVAAALIVIIVMAWSLVPFFSLSTVNEPLVQEVLSSHVRSLMANHLVDVASTDQHTVKPWFDGKLDFSPPVVDLASQGFPLVGGRLDYLNNRPVAALVYKYRNHYINLFIWPSTQSSNGNTTIVTRQGYHLFFWTRSGMTYWVVSDVEENTLQKFVQLIQTSIPGTTFVAPRAMIT